MKYCNCRSCLDGQLRLHVGDRVVFTRGFPTDMFPELMELCDKAALRQQGQVINDTTLVVTSNPDEPHRTAQVAKEKGIPVVTRREFIELVEGACDTGRKIYPLTNDFIDPSKINGGRIYPIRLSALETKTFEEFLLRTSSTLGQQLRGSLAAAVCSDGKRNGPEARICNSEGIPVFEINKIEEFLRL